MNDNDQTILSSGGVAGVSGSPQQPEKPKRNPLVLIGGIGCVLLLCAALLIGGGLYMAGDQISDLIAGEEATATPPPPTVAPTATATSMLEIAADESVETDEADDAASSENSDETDPETIEASGPPQIGSITFAMGATEDYEPVEPGTSFTGEITEIHAIFDYSGLSSDLIWERVWYLDGNEMLRSAEPWSGAASGTFDYFINAGGETLAPGEWVLELYIEDNLLTSGNFTIISEETPEIASTEEGELVAETDDSSEHDAEITPADAAAADMTTPTSTPISIPTLTPTPTPKAVAVAPSTKTSKLAYTKWDGGRHVLYVSDTDGSNEQFIMHNAAGPSWSPDGASIFFFGEPGVNAQNRDDFPDVGSCEFEGLSDGIVFISVPPPPAEVCAAESSFYQGEGWNDGTARWASVSPNGQMVAYDAKPGGDYRIYFLGTGESQQYNYEIIGEQADWSPDSQQIVYRSGRDGKTGIWISNRDDSGHVLITNANDSFPSWSTNGKSIAFAHDEDGNVDIYTVNVDGSNPKRLTDASGPDTLPVFTPSGQIIFRSARSGSWGIWKMNSDGSNQEEIIHDAAVGPDWTKSKMSVLR